MKLLTLFTLFFSVVRAHGQLSADFGGAGGGAVRVGDSATVCSQSTQGAVRYSTADGALQYCDGYNWIAPISTPCGSTLPTKWTFTDLTGQTPNTQITSGIFLLTGFPGCTLPLKVSGNGAPVYRICDDSSCTTVSQDWSTLQRTVANNKYVQVRLTTSTAGNTYSKATLAVGDRAETWLLKTSGSCADTVPPIGTLCTDGTVFVGFGPDGATKVYSTPCSMGKRWDGFACNGASATLTWAQASNVLLNLTNSATGEANTSTLFSLSNADSPYAAAGYCQALIFNGTSDWYLPSTQEMGLLRTGCDLIPDVVCSSSARFWTSRENSSTQANYFTYSGGVNQSVKTADYNIRCFRKD